MTFNLDMAGIVATVVLSTLGFFLVRTISKIDRNQERMFEKLDELNRQVSTLQGEHNAMQASCRKVLLRFSEHSAEDNL